jgi:hypothetical protein
MLTAEKENVIQHFIFRIKGYGCLSPDKTAGLWLKLPGSAVKHPFLNAS